MSHSIAHNGTLKMAESISSFNNQVIAFSKTIILLPAFIILLPIVILLFVFYYPVVLIGFYLMGREMDKIVKWVEKEGANFPYEETLELNNDMREVLQSLHKLLKMDPPKYSLLGKVTKNMSLKVEYIILMSNDILYVDTSSIKHTPEELKMFSDLEEFWGDVETYRKDTFEQLKDGRPKI